MSKLLGAASVVISVVIFAPAVGAGIALGTGMTITACIFAAVGLVLLVG